MIDPDRSTKPSTVTGKVFRLGMSEEAVGDTVPALGKSGGGGGGRPTTGWIAIGDLTAVLCTNFSGGDLTSGDPDDLKAMTVLRLAGKAAVRAR